MITQVVGDGIIRRITLHVFDLIHLLLCVYLGRLLQVTWGHSVGTQGKQDNKEWPCITLYGG
jgi:hypothetical protein